MAGEFLSNLFEGFLFRFRRRCSAADRRRDKELPIPLIWDSELSCGRASRGFGGISSLVAGQSYLKLPLPEPKTMQKIVDVFAALRKR